MYDNTSMRTAGVGIPASQRTQKGDSINTLENFEPTLTYAIRYTDDAGTEHRTVVMRIGSQWYMPPNGEAWAGTLQHLKDGTPLARQLSEAFVSQTAPLPKADAVDILGSSGKGP
jgi:hypothetical protein